MITGSELRSAAELAVKNIIKHGDTDIFPFPFENHIFFDKQSAVVDLIVEYYEHSDQYLQRYAPHHVSSLTPVTYSGFRWATQLDPVWNAYFLTSILAIAPKIERARPAKDRKIVFS